MPWRERRQALAELYLRHGYADSAAEEWIAVCEQGGVDAQALRGLAAVAVARGLDEDAQVFAAEADGAGRGLIGLKFSWRLPNPLTTSRARDGPDDFQEELRTP